MPLLHELLFAFCEADLTTMGAHLTVLLHDVAETCAADHVIDARYLGFWDEG